MVETCVVYRKWVRREEVGHFGEVPLLAFTHRPDTKGVEVRQTHLCRLSPRRRIGGYRPGC